MKYSNFKLIERTGKNALNWRFTASVTATHPKKLFRKKQEDTLIIYKEYGGKWFVKHTGKLVKGNIAEAERVFTAAKGCCLVKVVLEE